MRQVLKDRFIVFLFAGLFATLSPAREKTPRTPPDPKFMAIENISVLPIVDARAGRKASVNLSKLQGSVVNILNKKKHYPASAAGSSGMAGRIAVEDLESSAPAYIRSLGPADARWIMVICLDDAVSKMTFGSTGNAELSGYLFDKGKGELVWSGKGVGQAGQGGLYGMALKGMMKGEALDNAVWNLLGRMPNRPKPRK